METWVGDEGYYEGSQSRTQNLNRDPSTPLVPSVPLGKLRGRQSQAWSRGAPSWLLQRRKPRRPGGWQGSQVASGVPRTCLPPASSSCCCLWRRQRRPPPQSCHPRARGAACPGGRGAREEGAAESAISIETEDAGARAGGGGGGGGPARGSPPSRDRSPARRSPAAPER